MPVRAPLERGPTLLNLTDTRDALRRASRALNPGGVMRAFHARSAFAALTVLSALSALAQPYPARPIRLAVSGVGGSSNFAAHLISQGLSQRWGVPVVVDSRQSGAAVSEIVARAQPDGHTLLLNGSTLWLLPLLHARIAYDPIRDFAPVTLAMGTPSVLVVHPALPARSVQELIRLAKE
ncbi:hypothetical protein FJZ55_09895, partial [Candidatus Woesearchaeota archaeon]|nr:hypothetical protein [Candidatus Woesearchaeota archaeon]